VLDVVEELGQERRVEIFHPQVGGRTSKPRCREAKEKSEGITVAGNGMRAGAELSE
jgi:hypothetical protein